MLQTPPSLPPSRPIDILIPLLHRPALPNAPTHQLTTLSNSDHLQPSSSPEATTKHMMLLKTIFSNHFCSILVSYLDDILIFIQPWDNHFQPDRQILQLFREQQIQIKEKNSYLLQHSVQHSVQHSAPPSVQHSVPQSFLSAIKFSNQFILHLSHIARPIHHQYNSYSTFIQTNKDISYFVQLQETLCSSLVWYWTNLSPPLVTNSDTSHNVMDPKLK